MLYASKCIRQKRHMQRCIQPFRDRIMQNAIASMQDKGYIKIMHRSWAKFAALW
jgi:hypothetical protein